MAVLDSNKMADTMLEASLKSMVGYEPTSDEKAVMRENIMNTLVLPMASALGIETTKPMSNIIPAPVDFSMISYNKNNLRFQAMPPEDYNDICLEVSNTLDFKKFDKYNFNILKNTISSESSVIKILDQNLTDIIFDMPADADMIDVSEDSEFKTFITKDTIV